MADKRVLYTEQMVGAGHPGKADTLNRLTLVEHNTDGTHNIPSSHVYDDLITKGPWVDVRAFGGVGDGTADDTAAIQAAIDSLPAVGGTVLIPSGWWKLSSGLTISSSAVTIRGQGIGNSSRLYFSNTDYDGITITGGDCLIENISIGYVANTGTSCSIRDSAVEGTMLNRVRIDGGHDGVISSSAKSVFSDLHVINTTPSTSVGLTYTGNSEVRELRGFFFENAPGNDAYAGVQINDGAGIQISNCDIQKAGIPLRIAPGGTNDVFSVNVENTFFDTSSGYGVCLAPTASGFVSRIRFSNCWFSSCDTGVYVDGNVKGLVITGSEFLGNANDGINVVTGSVLDAMVVTGCIFAGNGGDGAHIGAGVSDFMFTGNHFGPGGGLGGNNKGVTIEAGASDEYVITGNRIRGNGVAELTDGGTGINKVVGNNLI